jgi:phosphatidylglycerophosphate synthase
MTRPTLAELERRCQKPDYRQVGTWMARRISRPAALRITAVVAPWGVSAAAATLSAWGLATAAACVLGWGTPSAWLVAALLLQLWYLLDHVDGQLARLYGTASLDGAQLDYLMHHTVNLLVPVGAGFGLFVHTTEAWWLVAGLVWGVSLLLITLRHDAGYRSFIARLQQLHGRLEVRGGATWGTFSTCRRDGDESTLCAESNGTLQTCPTIVRLSARLARKACEIHVVMNLLLLVALVQCLVGDAGLWAGRAFVAMSASLAVAVAFWSLARSQAAGHCEQEFAAWFRVPPGHVLLYRDGRWHVQEEQAGGSEGNGGGQAAESS